MWCVCVCAETGLSTSGYKCKLFRCSQAPRHNICWPWQWVKFLPCTRSYLINLAKDLFISLMFYERGFPVSGPGQRPSLKAVVETVTVNVRLRSL